MQNIKLFENFIDSDTCDHMIKVYNRLFEGKNKQPDGRKLLHNIHDPEIIDFLKIYLPIISERLGKTYYIRDLLLSIYEEGAYVKPHVDFIDENLQDSFGLLFYFNEDFEGGEVYFSKFEYEYHPTKGSAFIFPCNGIEYEHGVKPITRGIRYTMPLEITPKKELEVISI